MLKLFTEVMATRQKREPETGNCTEMKNVVSIKIPGLRAALSIVNLFYGCIKQNVKARTNDEQTQICVIASRFNHK
jgi:hypothetical protein